MKKFAVTLGAMPAAILLYSASASAFSVKVGTWAGHNKSKCNLGFRHMKKKSHFVVAAAALFATTTTQAVELEVSGQVNRAVMAVDDGEDTETFFVDNTNSSSRFRFSAAGELTDTIEAGALFEVEFESNPGSAVSRENPDIAGELQERHLQVFFTGNFGGVFLGQGDGAANGITHIDLSGTGVVSLLGHQYLVGGGTAFLDNGVAGPTVSQAAANFDFESRYDRIAYEAPALGPVVFSVSAGRKDEMIYEAAARYTSDFAFGKIAAGVGYSTEDVVGPEGSNDTLGGSATVLLDGGFNAAVSYSQLENDADYDAKSATVRLGYRTGQHAASIDFGRTEDRALPGDEADVVGVNYVFSPVNWIELYASGRVFSLDRNDADFNNINVLIVGSRVKF